jgi:hypothetical protein
MDATEKRSGSEGELAEPCCGTSQCSYNTLEEWISMWRASTWWDEERKSAFSQWLSAQEEGSVVGKLSGEPRWIEFVRVHLQGAYTLR